MRTSRVFGCLAVLTALATLATTATASWATAPGKNGRIVFRRYLDVGRTTGALYATSPNGTKVRQVTHPSRLVIDTEPDWSPNGSQIAFQRQVPCPPGGSRDGLDGYCSRIYTVRSDGKRLKLLVPCGFKVPPGASSRPGIDCVAVYRPAWSPDGSKIAFQYDLVDPRYVGSLNLAAGIWIVNADGTGLRQVTERTPGTSWDFGSQWSPDGTKLVFSREDFVRELEAVFTVNVDGSDERQVTPWELNAGNGPDWSPDGQWILFTGAPKDGSANVYKVHPDGSGLANLTRQPPNGYHYLSSSFSPDGRMIATSRTPGAGPERAADVFVMNADGSKIRRVTKTRLWDSGPDWGPARTSRR